MNVQTRLAQAGTLALTGLLLFSLGLLIGRILAETDGPRQRSGRIMPERSRDFDLTNPLLECEGGGDSIGNQALRPFKDELARVVDRLIRSGLARQISVYFRDLNNGPWYGIDENIEFYPASLLKVPLAMAVMKESESDPQMLTRAVINTPQENRRAAGPSTPTGTLVRGQTYTIEELLEIMLTLSDADAAALLAQHVDPAVAAGVFSDLGIPAPAEAGRDVLSVRSFAKFFRVLFNASYLTKRSSEQLLSLLSRSSFRSGIASGVPDGVAVANKYGQQELGPRGEIKELHDCGIVYYPKSPYLLCIMTKGERFEGNAAAIQEISRLVFSIVDAHESGKAWGNRDR